MGDSLLSDVHRRSIAKRVFISNKNLDFMSISDTLEKLFSIKYSVIKKCMSCGCDWGGRVEIRLNDKVAFILIN